MSANNNEDIAGAAVGNGGAIVDNDNDEEIDDEDEPPDEIIAQRPSPAKIQELRRIRPHLENIVIALETWDVTHEEKAHFYSGLLDPFLWTFVEMARFDWLEKTTEEKDVVVAMTAAPSLPVLLTILSMSADNNSPERPDAEAIQRLRKMRHIAAVFMSLEAERPGVGVFQHAMHDPFVWSILQMARKAKKVATGVFAGLLALDQHAIPERGE